MTTIRTIEQFQSDLNEVLSPVERAQNYDQNRQKVETIKKNYVSLAEHVMAASPDSSVRSLALSGLIGSAYVVVFAAVGAWQTKAAA